MRRYVWILRACLLLVAGAACLGAVKAREPDEPHRDGVAGLTGQRQPIDFDVDGEGRPRRFATTLYAQCPAGHEWPVYWATAALERSGSRFQVTERDGRGWLEMLGRVTPAGPAGRMRAVWRFERDGEEYVVCDSGFVPFAAGDVAVGRLGRMRPSAEPWTAYPVERPPAAAGSPEQRRFLARLDAVCERAWRDRPSGEWWNPHLRALQREYDALARLGLPPTQRAEYASWLHARGARVSRERAQQRAMASGDLDSAARWAAQVAALRARANADGLRLGLRACTATGPIGAPKGSFGADR